MHGTGVERVFRSGNAQEARTLLIGSRAKAWHLLQLCARGEGTVLLAVVDDVLSQSRTESTDVGEQVFARRVEVHAHRIDTEFDGLVQAVLEFGLIHVVLVLSHADTLRVDLHQFCQWVHESPPDAYGTAHGDILVGKLLTGCR